MVFLSQSYLWRGGTSEGACIQEALPGNCHKQHQAMSILRPDISGCQRFHNTENAGESLRWNSSALYQGPDVNSHSLCMFVILPFPYFSEEHKQSHTSLQGLINYDAVTAMQGQNKHAPLLPQTFTGQDCKGDGISMGNACRGETFQMPSHLRGAGCSQNSP